MNNKLQSFNLVTIKMKIAGCGLKFRITMQINNARKLLWPDYGCKVTAFQAQVALVFDLEFES